jgi:hypothetical protein
MNFYNEKHDLLKERIDALCSNEDKDDASKSGFRRLKERPADYKPKEDRRYKSPSHILIPSKPSESETDTHGLDINVNWA